MILLLFTLLGLLNLLEATTPLARMAGIISSNFASGLQLQSSLSIVSRAINALYLPILGFVADSGYLSNLSSSELIFFNSIPILILLSFYFINNIILDLYLSITRSMVNTGSLFNFNKYWNKYYLLNSDGIKEKNSTILKRKGFSKFRLLTMISFIPFYLSWPICFILLSHFPSSRGIVLGSTSVLNGLNSLSLVLLVDPYLIKISRYNNLSNIILIDQVKMRIIASIISLSIVILILCVL